MKIIITLVVCAALGVFLINSISSPAVHSATKPSNELKKCNIQYTVRTKHAVVMLTHRCFTRYKKRAVKHTDTHLVVFFPVGAEKQASREVYFWAKSKLGSQIKLKPATRITTVINGVPTTMLVFGVVKKSYWYTSGKTVIH